MSTNSGMAASAGVTIASHAAIAPAHPPARYPTATTYAPIGPGVERFTPPWAVVTESGELVVKGFDGALPRRGVALRATEDALHDPVCLLPIDPDDAYATATDPAGAPVVFCSESCQVSWQAAPAGQPLF